MKRLQAHTHNMKYVLLFHGNYGYATEHQCYVYTYIACLVIFKTRLLNGGRMGQVTIINTLRTGGVI